MGLPPEAASDEIPVYRVPSNHSHPMEIDPGSEFAASNSPGLHHN